MALFVSEGGHAVGISDLGRGTSSVLGKRQHPGCIATVKFVILRDLDQGQIARKGPGCVLTQTIDLRHVSIDPCACQGNCRQFAL